MSIKTVCVLVCDRCGGGLGTSAGTIEASAIDLLGPAALHQEADRHGWVRTPPRRDVPARDLCRFCAADERREKRMAAKARKAARESAK